jgi:ABC-2 type transport system ATP-binding protein
MLVQTRSLWKRYGRVTALADCTLGVPRGEVFGLLGPNGSGKTTLLRLLLGFLRPTSGSAAIDGLDCYRDSVAVHTRVAYLPGEVRLFRHMRGIQVLQYFSEVRPGGRLDRSLELAERLGVELSRRVPFLSTGTRQKLGLVAILAADVPLLILDEPTTTLDPTARGEVLALVREAKAAGRTVIFSSHVLSEVEEVCDRVGILRLGDLVHVQVMSELRRRHRIHGRLTGSMPPVPEALAGELAIHHASARQVTIESAGQIGPLLGWLATLPLADVRIEPIGLRSIYDRYHEASPA